MFDILILAALVSMLGSPSWHTRELAHRALQARPDAVPMLRACQGCKSPEIAGRATQILSGHYRANAERLTAGMTPADWPHLPWVDMLPGDYPGRDSIVSDYLGKAQSKIGRCNSPVWDDYRLATRMFVLDLFLGGSSPEAVQELVNLMADAEVEWVRANGKRYNPPLELPQKRVKIE